MTLTALIFLFSIFTFVERTFLLMIYAIPFNNFLRDNVKSFWCEQYSFVQHHIFSQKFLFFSHALYPFLIIVLFITFILFQFLRLPRCCSYLISFDIIFNSIFSVVTSPILSYHTAFRNIHSFHRSSKALKVLFSLSSKSCPWL